MTRRALYLSLFPTLAFGILTGAGCGDDGSRGTDDTGVDTADVTDDADVADTTDTNDGDVGLDADTFEQPDGDVVDEETDTVDPLVDEWPEVPRTDADPDADATAWTPADGVPEGEARLGLLAESSDSPFSGPEARCREGDFVLANAHVVACIAGLSPPSQYTYTGGFLIDIAPADAMDDEMLEALVPGMELRTVQAKAMTALSDGREGGPAVLRVEGTLRTSAVIGNFLGDLLGGPALDFETEFRLAPDARTVEAVTWVWATLPTFVRARVTPGDLAIAGDHVAAWAPEYGELAPFFRTETPTWMGISPYRAYGVFTEDLVVTALAPGVLESDIDPLILTDGVLGPNAEAVFVRHYGVADNTLELEAMFGLRPAPDALSPVTLERTPDARFPEQRIVLRDADDAHVGVIWLDAEGAATVDLPDGTYTATWWGAPDGPATSFDIPATAPVDMEVPDRGLLQIWVDATDGETTAPSPARVRIGGPENLEVYVVRGALDVPLTPGTYSVEISRGEEFSLDVHTDVVIASGEETEINASLLRQLDTDGWASGDFHQHQRRSIDSDVENTDRVATNLAAGVDFIGSSDHDAIEDMGGVVDQMGVGDLVYPFVGIEISPRFGHMNAFPFPYRPELDRMGAVPLSTIDDDGITPLMAPQLAAAARDLGARVIQLNHPRRGAAYFDSSGYDPVIGPDDVDTDFWPGDFNALEVVNDTDAVCTVMQDWFSMLRRGYRVTGVGNSDTHGFGDPAGWPRNYLHVGDDDPTALTDDILSDAILAMNVSVSGGIFLDFPGELLPGEMIETAEGGVAIPLRAQSPEWLSAETIVVYVNGIEVDRFSTETSGPEAIVDYDDDIELVIAEDAFVVFFAFANGRQTSVTPGKQIFGFTNPVFIDADLDGEWTPPGVASAEDVPLPTALPFCP
jgi:hypothetical protein